MHQTVQLWIIQLSLITIKVDNFMIINTATTDFELSIKESILIKQMPAFLNNNDSSINSMWTIAQKTCLICNWLLAIMMQYSNSNPRIYFILLWILVSVWCSASYLNLALFYLIWINLIKLNKLKLTFFSSFLFFSYFFYFSHVPISSL